MPGGEPFFQPQGLTALLRALKRRGVHTVAYSGYTLEALAGREEPAVHEALDTLEGAGLHLDALRVRGFPFADEVFAFIAAHDRVFVIEQNRDAQLRTLLINEGEIDPSRLTAVLHYDGTPITARFIAAAVRSLMADRRPMPEAAE